MNKKNLTRETFWKEKLPVVLFYISLLCVWQLLYWVGTEQMRWWKSYSFPSPLGVMETLKSLIDKGTLFQAFLYSLFRGVVGFGI